MNQDPRGRTNRQSGAPERVANNALAELTLARAAIRTHLNHVLQQKIQLCYQCVALLKFVCQQPTDLHTLVARFGDRVRTLPDALAGLVTRGFIHIDLDSPTQRISLIVTDAGHAVAHQATAHIAAAEAWLTTNPLSPLDPQTTALLRHLHPPQATMPDLDSCYMNR